MNKKRKVITVLTNYQQIIQMKKTNIIKDVKGLENYKKDLALVNKIIFTHIGTKMLKNKMFSSAKSKKSTDRDVELFILNPNTNSVRMLSLIEEACINQKNNIIVIYQQNSLGINVLTKLGKVRNLSLIAFEALSKNDVNKVIHSTFALANLHMNILESAGRFFLSTNLMPFEIKRTQIAPIIDDKLDLEQNMLSNASKGLVETFVPTQARWLQNIFEGYIYLKIKKVFVDLEIASKMQEIIKANQSLDILKEKIEQINYELQMDKIKNSSDELSILQGGGENDYKE